MSSVRGFTTESMLNTLNHINLEVVLEKDDNLDKSLTKGVNWKLTCRSKQLTTSTFRGSLDEVVKAAFIQTVGDPQRKPSESFLNEKERKSWGVLS